MFRIVLGFALLAAFAAHDARIAHAAPQPAEILAQWKAASGGAAWDDVRVVRTRARIETSGLAGPSETIEDARTGAYVTSYNLGPVKGAAGFDGQTVWTQDTSGQVAVQGGADAREGAANNAYRAARGFWYPARWPAQIVYAGRKSDAGRSFDVLTITPKGGRPFDVWFDVQSHLIDRQVEKTSLDVQTTFAGDYRAVAGKLIPFFTRTTNGETRYDQVIKVEAISFEADAPKTAFAPPAPPARDFGFLGGGHSATFPFKLINNHMYVEVKLNGRVFELLFDTGGSNVITPTVARALGLRQEGALQGRGVGEKSEDVAVSTIARMEMGGGAFMNNQMFAVFPLESFGDIEGKPITGIFGYEVFKRFVVRTDYEHQTVTLIDPDGFAYRGPGVRVPFELKESIPIVQGEIDGVPGAFQLDTGSRSTLDLMTPFIAKNNLVARYQAKVQGVTGWGVGGPARSWLVRARRFSFGGVAVSDIVLGLSQQTKGALTDQYTAGNVGAGVLKQFNIVWDYPRHQIFFEKNALYGLPDVFDRGGLWANLAPGGGFAVVDVFAHGPALEAGLKTGDRIVAVDGQKAGTGITLPDFRLALKRPVGTTVTLTVDRNGQTLTIPVKLRDLI